MWILASSNSTICHSQSPADQEEKTVAETEAAAEKSAVPTVNIRPTEAERTHPAAEAAGRPLDDVVVPQSEVFGYRAGDEE